ncbi:MAG: DUF2891 domain-containing protein [Thermomicrobiales bacterium]
MSFDRDARLALLRDNAESYARSALNNIQREYPHFPYMIATEPGQWKSHREFHPAFFGSFDWHSCVEMHWVLVCLLQLHPDHAEAAETSRVLNDLLTSENLQRELDFFTTPGHRSHERPYGWGWLLTLAAELQTWDDNDGQRWFSAIEPLADLFASNFVAWLPKQTYPIRSGMHNNTAFGLLRSLEYADVLADRGDPALLDAIVDAAARWYLADTDYPCHYEPSGADFLSAGLTEAEFMSRVVDQDVFPDWLSGFMPDIEFSAPPVLFHPVISSDHSDGQIAHLEGLNLSRAASFLAIADALPENDLRIPALIDAAQVHATASLGAVVGGDYMTEHWLSAYATLLLRA